MHLHVLHHSVSWGSQVRVLRRSKVPWDSQFRREGVCNSYEYFLSNSSGCRVPAPSVPALRSKEPRVNKRKLQEESWSWPTQLQISTFFLSSSPAITNQETFPRRQRALYHLHSAQTNSLSCILLPLSKTYGKKNLKTSKLEWTLEIILFSLSFYK